VPISCAGGPSGHHPDLVVFKNKETLSMSLKLTVGLAKKIGQPDYGSLGASCQLELELDQLLLEQPPDRFREQVQQAYAACSQAVHDELTRQQSLSAGDDRAPSRADHRAGYSNGHSNGHSNSPRPATPSQLRALAAIAARGRIDLASEVSQQFAGARPEDLSISQASQLIDRLKIETANGASR
jgi:hypothetical protein